MKPQGRREVAARIEGALRATTGGVVAVDGDGTLWSGDVAEDLFYAFVERGRVEPEAERAILRAAAEHGVDASGTGAAVARRIYGAYLDDRFPEEEVCELMTWCFAGWTRDKMQGFARDVMGAAGLEGRLNPELCDVLERIRPLDAEVFLVSASPRAVVEEAARIASIIALTHVVAATPVFTGDIMRAEVDRPIPYGPGKVSRLRERIGTRRLCAAFGDSAFDLPMLSEAAVPVAVRPKPKLRARAAEVDGLVELVAETQTL